MPSERRAAIRELLTREGELRVEDMVERFGVTSMTIRRDLSAMEEEGLLIRTHGGCRIQSPMVSELSFSEKDRLNADRKAAVAAAAAGRVTAGMSLFLDTGTTALHLARLLPAGLGLRVFTNNLRVAMDLFGREDLQVTVFGGEAASRSPDLVGESACAHAREYRLDLAALGADAVDPARGECYSADTPTAILSRIVQERSEARMLLADSSKLGKRGLNVVATLEPGITLVTDDRADEADLRRLRETGAEVVVAPTDPKRTAKTGT